MRASGPEAFDPVPVLKAMGHPLRFSLLQLLAEGEKCVCDLSALTDASQPLVSHHLAILRKARLINGRHEATWAYYSIDRENWSKLQDYITSIHPGDTTAPLCPPKLRAGELEQPSPGGRC